MAASLLAHETKVTVDLSELRSRAHKVMIFEALANVGLTITFIYHIGTFVALMNAGCAVDGFTTRCQVDSVWILWTTLGLIYLGIALLMCPAWGVCCFLYGAATADCPTAEYGIKVFLLPRHMFDDLGKQMLNIAYFVGFIACLIVSIVVSQSTNYSCFWDSIWSDAATCMARPDCIPVISIMDRVQTSLIFLTLFTFVNLITNWVYVCCLADVKIKITREETIIVMLHEPAKVVPSYTK